MVQWGPGGTGHQDGAAGGGEGSGGEDAPCGDDGNTGADADGDTGGDADGDTGGDDGVRTAPAFE